MYPEDERDNVIGYTTFESYRPDEVEEFLKEDKKAFKEGYASTLETINFPNGSRQILHTTKTRFNNERGNNFILGVCVDVTEREKLISKLQKSNHDLDQFAICGFA